MFVLLKAILRLSSDEPLNPGRPSSPRAKSNPVLAVTPRPSKSTLKEVSGDLGLISALPHWRKASSLSGFSVRPIFPRIRLSPTTTPSRAQKKVGLQ